MPTSFKKQAATDIKSAVNQTQTIQTENNDDLANVLKTGMSFACYDRQRINRECTCAQPESADSVINQFNLKPPNKFRKIFIRQRRIPRLP